MLHSFNTKDNKVIVTLDFYNLNFYIKTGTADYHWNSETEFLQDTGYPFTTTKLLSIEPHRDIYHIQRADNTFENNSAAPEVVWFLEHEIALAQTVARLHQTTLPVLTLETERVIRLYDTDWLVQRHQEEQLRGVPTTLSTQEFTDLLNYKQQLRDLTNQYPLNTPVEQVTWPINPIN